MARSAIILGLALAVVGCGKGDGGAQPGETRLSPEGEKMLSSAELARAYAADPEGFEKQFKNKMVIVEGEVTFDKVTETATGREMIMMEGYQGGEGPSIQIRCLKSGIFADELIGVSAGRKISVRGRINPTEGRKFLLLTECNLVSK